MEMEVEMTDPTGNVATIVVCEHDDATLDLLCEHLVADGFQALPAPTATDALRLCRHNPPDLLLVDLALPDASGLALLREIREADPAGSPPDPDLPVIVLIGRGGTTDRVRGLDLGADDYVQKPFSYEELRARIQAVLRRRRSPLGSPVRVGELMIDPSRHKVMVGEREVRLARKEFTLLRVLASDPAKVFAKDELIRDIWGPEAPAARSRALESHASRLRRKLDPEDRRYVVNCWGVGYRLVGEPETADIGVRGEESPGACREDQLRADLEKALSRAGETGAKGELRGPAAELVMEVLGTALALDRSVFVLMEHLPEDAFPGEDNASVLLEMIVGSVSPAVAAAGEDECRTAIALVASLRERVLADLHTAARLASEDRP
jgi:DNA-binding response OmpR family regulator